MIPITNRWFPLCHQSIKVVSYRVLTDSGRPGRPRYGMSRKMVERSKAWPQFGGRMNCQSANEELFAAQTLQYLKLWPRLSRPTIRAPQRIVRRSAARSSVKQGCHLIWSLIWRSGVKQGSADRLHHGNGFVSACEYRVQTLLLEESLFCICCEERTWRSEWSFPFLLFCIFVWLPTTISSEVHFEPVVWGINFTIFYILLVG